MDVNTTAVNSHPPNNSAEEEQQHISHAVDTFVSACSFDDIVNQHSDPTFSNRFTGGTNQPLPQLPASQGLTEFTNDGTTPPHMPSQCPTELSSLPAYRPYNRYVHSDLWKVLGELSMEMSTEESSIDFIQLLENMKKVQHELETEIDYITHKLKQTEILSEDENTCQNEDMESDIMVSDMMSVDNSYDDDNDGVDNNDGPDADQTAGGVIGEDITPQHMECLVLVDSKRTKCDITINGRSIRDRTAECKDSIDRAAIKSSKDEQMSNSKRETIVSCQHIFSRGLTDKISPTEMFENMMKLKSKGDTFKGRLQISIENALEQEKKDGTWTRRHGLRTWSYSNHALMQPMASLTTPH